MERKAPADTGFPGIVGEGHFSHFATAIPFPHRNLEPFLIFILEVITGELKYLSFDGHSAFFFACHPNDSLFI